MAVQTYVVRLRRAYSPLSQWLADNPLLLYGEFAFVTDVPGYEGVKLKIGDGFHKFSETPWYESLLMVSDDQVGKPNGVVPLDKFGIVPLEFIPDEAIDNWAGLLEENKNDNEFTDSEDAD